VSGKPLLRHFNSFVWPSIRKHIDTIIGNSMLIVGSSEHINVWNDNWLGDNLLSLLDLPNTLASSDHRKVTSLITNGQWDVPQGMLSIPVVADRILHTIIPICPMQDQLVWLHSPECGCSSLGFTYLASLHSPFSHFYILASDA
jgi:hypothetical protein